MATRSLKTWPFPENEEVELIWFGSPYVDYKGDWKLRVAFKTEVTGMKLVSYAWGTLPDLRIGQIFVNGAYDPIRPMSGSAFHFTIESLGQGQVTNGFNLPKRLIDFGKNPELGLQNIIQYQCNGLIYNIPVIELIRVLFVNSRYLSYTLLQPHGLDLLIDISQSRGGIHYFELNNRVPANHATEQTAHHLSWIHTDPRIKSLWDSVYHNMFNRAVKSSPNNPHETLKKGVPLDITLPAVGPLEFYVRGVQFRDHVLVKEILTIGGFQHPSNKLLFWHPSKKRREWSSGDKAVRITAGGNNKDYILSDQGDNAKEDVNQEVLETPPTAMKFINHTVIETRQLEIRHSNTGTEVIVTSGRGGKHAEAKEVSTLDSMVGGDTPPIDFKTLEVIPANESMGLESFFQMIEVLKQSFPVTIRMSVLRVPTGKRFSICPNGSRRTCAVVQLVYGVSTIYIVEVARPDDWSISTLLLRPTNQFQNSTIEKTIKHLLDGLVQKGGHWDQNNLNQCNGMSIDKLKHYQSDTIHDWAYRLAGKLMT